MDAILINERMPSEGSTARVLYPPILRRMQAASIDGLIIPVAAIGSIGLFTGIGVQSGYLKAALACLTILLLEPLAVSFTGGSVGHHIVGVRVRRLNTDTRLNPAMALWRFVAKICIGYPAFFVSLITKRRQGLHDVLARSLVVYKNPALVPAFEGVAEMSRDDEQKAHVIIARRVAVVLGYWFGASILFPLVASISMSPQCAQDVSCGGGEALLVTAELVLFAVACIAIAVLGVIGRLYGCRKPPKPN